MQRLRQDLMQAHVARVRPLTNGYLFFFFRSFCIGCFVGRLHDEMEIRLGVICYFAFGMLVFLINWWEWWSVFRHFGRFCDG